MPEKLIIFFLPAVIIAGVLSGCAREKDQTDIKPQPRSATEVSAEPAWRQVEAALSEALLGTADAKCEWEIWGWHAQERYLWAFCQAGSEFDAKAVSLPVVVTESTGGAVKVLGFPEEGSDFELGVKQWFPPAVQEKILANDFDLASAMGHLEERWNYPAMPPSIYSRTDQSLPISGSPSILAVSARTAGQITQSAVLGQGNIQSLHYLPDDQIVVSGDRGIGLLDIKSGQIAYQYQDLLAGRPGFLSNDGKRLAVVDGQTVLIYDLTGQTLMVSIDTGDSKVLVNQVHFLPDGMTIIVERVNPASEESSAVLEKYQLSDGRLLETWWLMGKDSVISPDGKVVVDSKSPLQLDVWSVYTAERKYSLPVVPNAVSFSGDSQIMAVVSLGKVRLFWVWDGFEIGSLQKGVGSVSGAALSPDGKLVLTWSDGPNPARLWTVPDFQPVATLEIQGVSTAAFNQDGSLIALAGDTAVAQYNVATGEFLLTPSGTFTSITDLSFAPDRTFSQGQRLAVVYGRGIVASWDVETKKPLFVQPGYAATSLVYARDPYGIAIGTAGRTVEILDAATGTLLRMSAELPAQVKDLALSSANQLAAGSLQRVRIYSLTNPNDKLGRKLKFSGGWAEEVIWPCYLAVKTTEGKVIVFDEAGEKVEQVLGMSTYGYTAPMAASIDCSQLWAANYISVYRWDTATWEQLPTWKLDSIITALAVSQDGTLAAVGLMDGRVQLLDSGSGEVLFSLDGHAGEVTALEFSPDGQFLASGSDDGVVILWGVK